MIHPMRIGHGVLNVRDMATCEDGLEHFRTRTEPATAVAIDDL